MRGGGRPGSLTTLEALGNNRIAKVVRIVLVGLLTLALATLLADPATAPAKKKGPGLSKRLPKDGLWKGSVNYVSQVTFEPAGQVPLSFRSTKKGMSDFAFSLPEPPRCSEGNPPSWWPYPLPASMGVTVIDPYTFKEGRRFKIGSLSDGAGRVFRLDEYAPAEGSIFADGFVIGEFQGRTSAAGTLQVLSQEYAVLGSNGSFSQADCSYFLSTSWSAKLHQKKHKKKK